MHKQLWIGLLLGAFVYGASCASLQSEPVAGNAQKAARIELAQEFVRELEVIYRLQETAKKEFAEDSSASGKTMTSVRVGTRMLFEMKDSIDRLSMINVDARWAEFRDALKKLHQERIVLVARFNQFERI
jgi:hypothetical protein